MEGFAARGGIELTISGDGGSAPVSDISALRRRLVAGARVLVVTSDGTQVASIEDALAEDGMVALPVPDMHAALTRGTEHLPDLAIVDSGLPPGDGADLVPAFRSRMGRSNFPVILLADHPQAALHRPEIGATDYLAKPYSPPMLRARVRAWLARTLVAYTDGQAEMLLGEIGKAEVFGELGILRDQPRSATVIAVERTHCLVLRQTDFVATLSESVELANGLLRVVASRLYDADRKLARYAPDPLTGLASRRAFNEQYRRIAAGARRRKTGLLLLALDVLHLKAANDGFGYTLGDEVLRTVADALSEATRTTDVVARYGGDEFAVLLLDAMPKDVDVILGRVRDTRTALSTQRC